MLYESIVVPGSTPGAPLPWIEVGFAFDGAAHSIVFDDNIGIGAVMAIDDLTLGSTTVIPLPAALWLFLGALSSAALLTRRR